MALSQVPMAEPSYRLKRPVWPRILAGLVFVALAVGIWWASRQQSTSVRAAAEDSVLIPVTPPPPPPPEVKPPEPKPDEVPPQPTPQTAQPTPQQPSPAPAAPSQGQAVSIDGPPQAGGDAFNIGSGSGNGRTGAGPVGNALGAFNRATYSTYLEGEIRRALEASRDLRTAALNIRAKVWIDQAGRIVRVDAPNTDKLDAIRQALIGHAVRAPDASLAMPVSMGLDLRRPG